MRSDERILRWVSHRILMRRVDTEPVRILLVEDNEPMADAVRRGLIAEGFSVDLAANGDDGLWRAREFAYDLIILDVMLPGTNGYEICRTLRAEARTTPILLLTAKDGDLDVAEGLDLGADDYLTKPFAFVVLVARVRALVRRANPVPGSASITAGSMTIDPAQRRCRIDETTIELTPREFSLLETLARRVGEPLTRLEILDHVWGADFEGDSNVVDVYVGYLRKKLQPHLPASPIETVRGVGYRLVAS